jgi:TRAP-type C4-dicarboxylate transport system permease small subunit
MLKRLLLGFENWLLWIEKALAIIFCSTMCISLLLQVLFRYVFKISATWTEEVALITFVYSIFLGASLVVMESKHIGFDALVSFFREDLKFIVKLFSHIVVMLFLLVMIYAGYRLVLAGRTSVSTMLRLPMSSLYAIIPITGFTMLLHSISVSIRELTDYWGSPKG